MGNDVKKLVEKKVKMQFKDADVNIVFDKNKLVINVEGMLDDISNLLSNIASFVKSTGKFTGLPNFDVVLSVQGTFYSFEIEMYK